MKSHDFYIYSNIDFSRKSASATRMRYYAKALATPTSKVYLLSCSTNKISNNNFEEVANNIFIQKNIKSTTNFFRTLLFLMRMSDFSKNVNSNSFIFYPQPLVYLEILSLLYLKLLKKNQVYYEFNEVRKFSSSFHSPLTFLKPFYSIKKIIFNIVFTLLEPLLFFFDGLICISTNIEAYGKRFNSNTLYIPILTDLEKTGIRSNSIYHTKETFNIGFSGSISPSKENLDSFLKVLKDINSSGYKVSFNLCGIIEDEFYNKLFKSSDENSFVTYYGNLNNEELSTFLDQQHLLVIPRGNTLQNKYGFSTKLSDYLNHNKIILLTDISDNSMYIQDGINGYIVPPDDNDQMFNKISFIISNFNEIEEKIVANAADTSKNEFYYLNFAEKLQAFTKGSPKVMEL